MESKTRTRSTDGLRKREGSKFWWTTIAGKRLSTECIDREAARVVRAKFLVDAAEPRHAAAQGVALPGERKTTKRTKDGLRKRPGSKYWWTTIAGKRLSTQCVDREAARVVRAKLEREAADPRLTAAQRATIWDMIDDALEVKRHSKGKRGGTVTKNTLDICRAKLGHFARILGDERPLADVDYDAVGRVITQREKEPGSTKGSTVSQHEISKELQHLRFALRIQKIKGNYPHDVDHVTRTGKFAVGYEPRKRYLTWETIHPLLESIIWGNAGKVTQATIDRARALRAAGRNCRQIATEMQVGYATAHRYLRMKTVEPTAMAIVRAQHTAWIIACCARRIESYRAEMCDHDLVNWRVRLRGSKTGIADSVITIAPRFHDLLLFALRERPEVGPMYPHWGNLYRSLGLACRRIGIEKISPNDLRRTHASLLSQAGVPHSILKNVTRHTTTLMLDRVYGQQTLESTAHVIANIDTNWLALPKSTERSDGGET